VIHNLLMQKPAARILVVCPGELTQQWLCELYSKFGGSVFKLLDLHAPSKIRLSMLDRAIVSTTLATFRLAETLQSREWDLVVVDEVHHLLHTPALYQFVEELSRRVPSLLLLSAIPAQRREDEFLRLLRLLEPERYRETDTVAQERFRELYAAQEDIGRRMRRVTRKIEDLAAGDAEREDLVRLIERLVELPVLSRDSYLAQWASRIAALEEVIPESRRLIDYVAQQYRINQRILRNRRKRLIDEDRLKPVERRLSLLAYAPEQLEREVLHAAEDLLADFGSSNLAPEIRAPFVRVLQQSLLCATTADPFLQRLAEAGTALPLSPSDLAYVAAGHLTGYAEWTEYQDLLCRAVRPHAQDETLARVARRARAWREAESANSRRERVLEFFQDRMQAEVRPKVLVFAGYPGASQWIAEEIRREISDAAVREFRYDLDPEDKEEFVREFKNDPGVWILVSDETGGEGRNFQFVDEILHVDTPWSVARVEQRIGRLDRLGRAEIRPDVLSHVVIAQDSLESALVQCYAEGVGVYRESISGLEFALREVEEAIASRACEGGPEAMQAYVPLAEQILTQERARDEGEALFDQASFNSAAAERMQRVTGSVSDEQELEKSFCRYLKAVSSHHAVREMNDRRYPGAIWTFKPDDFRRGVLPEGSGERTDLFRPHTGTFRRKVAQEKLDIEFFTTGNAFFDAVTNSLWEGAVGRSYAIACRSPNPESWIGLEFAFRAEPNWAALGDRLGLRNRVSMIFPMKPKSIFVSSEGQIEGQDRAGRLIQTRFQVELRHENEEWINLTGKQLLDATEEYWGANWQDSVQQAFEAARSEARSLFSRRLERDLAHEHERLSDAIRQARLREADAEEIDALEAVQFALSGWDLTLDAAGLLAINPEQSR
jgi:ATP-dependent helicase HepA